MPKYLYYRILEENYIEKKAIVCGFNPYKKRFVFDKVFQNASERVMINREIREKDDIQHVLLRSGKEIKARKIPSTYRFRFSYTYCITTFSTPKMYFEIFYIQDVGDVLRVEEYIQKEIFEVLHVIEGHHVASITDSTFLLYVKKRLKKMRSFSFLLSHYWKRITSSLIKGRLETDETSMNT